MSWEGSDRPRDEDEPSAVAVTPQVRVLDAHGSRVGLDLPDGLTFNEWQRIGDQLHVQQDASLWWSADWAAYGDRRYRRDYGEALERLYARGSLYNLAADGTVCGYSACRCLPK